MAWPTLTDYNEAVQNPQVNFLDPELRAGEVETNRLGLPRAISGGFATVYRMHRQDQEWAVRCFQREFADQQRRYEAISRHLGEVQLRYTVGFEFLPAGIRVGGGWFPILKMEWVQGETLDVYLANHLQDSGALRRLCEGWRQMAAALATAKIAHGDLQHGNVLVRNDTLTLIDYDGMWIPPLAGFEGHEMGHRNYQLPARRAADFGAAMDNFSAIVIYVSLAALSVDTRLWEQVRGGDECLLFRREDFVHPGSSAIFGLLRSHEDLRLRSMGRSLEGLVGLSVAQVPPLAAWIVATGAAALAVNQELLARMGIPAEGERAEEGGASNLSSAEALTQAEESLHAAQDRRNAMEAAHAAELRPIEERLQANGAQLAALDEEENQKAASVEAAIETKRQELRRLAEEARGALISLDTAIAEAAEHKGKDVRAGSVLMLHQRLEAARGRLAAVDTEEAAAASRLKQRLKENYEKQLAAQTEGDGPDVVMHRQLLEAQAVQLQEQLHQVPLDFAGRRGTAKREIEEMEGQLQGRTSPLADLEKRKRSLTTAYSERRRVLDAQIMAWEMEAGRLRTEMAGRRQTLEQERALLDARREGMEREFETTRLTMDMVVQQLEFKRADLRRREEA